MIEPKDNESLDNDQDFLDTDNDRPQDGNADAAENTTEEYEQGVLIGQQDETTNTDSVRFNTDEQQQAVDQKQSDEAPLTTQGDADELEENLGGTTNLTLDQLKREHDPEGRPGN